jgi:predicted SprT family Zn-dependent metalloprotease
VNRIRDGLTDWHLDFCRTLILQLLSRGPIKDPEKDESHGNLASLLAKRAGVPGVEIVRVKDILVVTRTYTGISHHQSFAGVPIGLTVNFGGLENFLGGAEFEEYESFKSDPVIGSRWVQNVEEAILMTLGHELAHHVVALQHKNKPTKPHGAEFKEAYQLIRRFAVNPMLDEFAVDAKQRTAAQFEARLIKKIHALQKMATDATSNENEAERALAQMQALKSKYGLADTLLSDDSKPHVIERTVPVVQREGYKALTHLCWSIARFCGVEAVWHPGRLTCWEEKNNELHKFRWSYEYITYFGSSSDTEMAVYLSELIFHSLFEESKRYRTTENYREGLVAGHKSRTLVFSFRRGFVARINRRLDEGRKAVREEWVASRADGRELMTHKDSVLQALFKQRYPKLGQMRDTSSSSVSIGSANKAGRSAADRVNLNRPVGQNRPLALEHQR